MVKTIITLLNLLCGLVLIGAIGLEMELPPKDMITPEEYQQLMKLQSLGLHFSNQFKNITLADLDVRNTRASLEDLQCLSDLNVLMEGLRSGSYWSLKMIDSWGSIPSGILYLNLIDLGNYDECVKISKEISTTQTIQGKYCFAELPIGKLVDNRLSLLKIQIGVCFPSSCRTAQMDTLLNQVIENVLNINYTGQLVNQKSCRTSDHEPLDGITIFTIVLLSIFGATAVLATLYDYFVCEDQKQLPALVKIFSIRATSRALFRVTDIRTNPNVIDCLHGIRCMSLIWVVFGHDYMYGLLSPNVNTISVYSWFEEIFSNFIMHAPFSVDTFFFLSGLLVVMVALRSMERAKGKLNVPLMYLHRYLRLTPLLAIAILVYMNLMPLMVDGPLANRGIVGTSRCERTWFWTLLYMQNYATEDICLPHSWYLSVDMQLYIIAPIVLIALYKWGKKAAVGIVVLMLLLSTWLFTLMMVKKYSLFVRNVDQNVISAQRPLYFYTHLHAAPWLIGAVFGYFLHVNRGKNFKLSRLMVWISWLISLAIFFTSIFALYPYTKWNGPELSTLSDSLYYTLTRIAWPLGLCWVVFACMQGYGGMANSFLSSPLWQPLSKLSYSVYIWHIMIQEINVRRTQSNTYFSNYEIMLRFWSDFGFTVLFAYATYVTIESPLGGLENIMLSKFRRSPKPIEKISTDSQETQAEPAPEIKKEVPVSQLESEMEAVPTENVASAPSV